MLRDTETKVAGFGEVLSSELILLNLQSSLKNLLSLEKSILIFHSKLFNPLAYLGASDGDMNRNLLISSDTKGSDSVSRLRVDGGLTRELLQHLRCAGESVTRLANRDIESELLDAELTHGVG
jgi:hypothetical protein